MNRRRPDSDASLAQSARKPFNGDLDFIRGQSLKQCGEPPDLVQPAR
jgi:hypothetical protein